MLSIFRKKPATPLREHSLYFNLEPTFRCNLKCTTCPRNSVEGDNFDMSAEVFSRICKELKFARAVDLTGWGEPLLHPSITSMVKRVREKDIPVSMTSNATLLSEKMAGALIEAGLDRLAVSIDGLKPETYEYIRRGAIYEKVCQNVSRTVSMVEACSSPLEISLAFTIQQCNISELDLIIPWMKQHGVRILHLKHLNVLASEFDWNSSLLRIAHTADSDKDILRKVESGVLKIQEQAAAEGIQVNFYSQLPMDDSLEPRNCLADPLNAVYFSYDGLISPCCHLGHKVTRFFQGSLSPSADFIAGDIRRNRFKKIWNSLACQAFLGQFQQGGGPPQCKTCYLLYGK